MQVSHNHGAHMHSKGHGNQDPHYYHSKYSGGAQTMSVKTSGQRVVTSNNNKKIVKSAVIEKEGRIDMGENINSQLVKTTVTKGEPILIGTRITNYDINGREDVTFTGEAAEYFTKENYKIDQGNHQTQPIITTSHGEKVLINTKVGERRVVEVIEGETVVTVKSGSSEARTPNMDKKITGKEISDEYMKISTTSIPVVSQIVYGKGLDVSEVFEREEIDEQDEMDEQDWKDFENEY